MKNKKAILLPETLKIIIAVLCIVALIYLAVSLSGIFSARSERIRAEETLRTIADKANLLKINEKDTAVVLAPKGWSLVSFEMGDLTGKCNSKFCLCMCEELTCTKQYICKPTDRFILLRNTEGKETRGLDKEDKEMPFTLNYGFVDAEVYPYSKEPIKVTYGEYGEYIGVGVITRTTPLFLKFANEWLWSPDLANWMKTDTIQATGGLWQGGNLAKKNVALINKLKNIRASEAEGKKLLEQEGAQVSEGIVTMQIRK